MISHAKIYVKNSYVTERQLFKGISSNVKNSHSYYL